MQGGGRPEEDQQRNGCSCCGLAACFIIILPPECWGFVSHWTSGKIRHRNKSKLCDGTSNFGVLAK